MKKVMMAAGVSLILFACNIRNSNKNLGLPVSAAVNHFTDSTSVQIIDSVYDFGTVKEGERVIYNYRFKNTGNKPLIISSAQASCGCTVPEKPEEPIMPGKTGFLKVVFNSEGRVGPAHKEIMVASNAYPGFPTLLLKGVVDSKN